MMATVEPAVDLPLLHGTLVTRTQDLNYSETVVFGGNPHDPHSDIQFSDRLDDTAEYRPNCCFHTLFYVITSSRARGRLNLTA